MSIRVIAGSAKGRRLKRVPGDTTRPVMDRVKEALFSIIGRNVIDSVFLDLFAGTGSVGIEALSRGAARAVFVERDGKAVQTIKANLQITQLSANAVIHRTDVFAFLKRPPDNIYHYIYIAPPQYKGMWHETLRAVDANPEWLSEDTVVIAQIDPQEYNHPLVLERLEVYDERRYGKTMLVFFMLKTFDPPESTEEAESDAG